MNSRPVLALALAFAWIVAGQQPEHGAPAAATPSAEQQPQQPQPPAHAPAAEGRGGQVAAHEGGAAGEHHDDGLGMWKWVNFGILFAILAYYIGKLAPPFFAARIAGIQKEITEARQEMAEAETRVAAIEKRLANLDAELASLRSDAKREMEAESVRIQDETRRAAARAEEQVAQEINSLSKAAENSLRAETSRLALELAEKKLKSRMSAETEGSLVSRFVTGLRSATGSRS